MERHGVYSGAPRLTLYPIFMRSFYSVHRITPDVREATHFLASKGIEKKQAKKHLFNMQQGCQIAGMRRPTSWCIG